MLGKTWNTFVMYSAIWSCPEKLNIVNTDKMFFIQCIITFKYISNING